MENQEFMFTVANSSNMEERGTHMHRVWKKLKRLQPILKHMTNKTTAVVKKIQENRKKLAHIEHLLENNLFNQEHIGAAKHWSEEIMKATELKEQIMHQK